MEDLTPMAAIRQRVFGMTQQRFAEMLHISQPTVVRYDSVGYCPHDVQVKIRNAAHQRGLEWSDSYFFEPAPEKETA